MAATTPRKEQKTGANLTGSDADINRTYTLTYEDVNEESFNFVVDRNVYQLGTDFSYVTSTRVVTFLGRVYDDQQITFNYLTEEPSSYSGSVIEQMRFNLIQENNSDVLSDDLCNHYLSRALTQQVSTNVDAQILYACYLVANNWQSLGFVKRHDGVAYDRPDPKAFLNDYNDLISKLANGTEFSMGMEKVNTNKDFTYDDDTRTLRSTRSSDGY